MIRILGQANSFNVRKVLWTCGELGLQFVREDWGRGFRPTTEPAFRALNPIGLVPAILDGEVVLRESEKSGGPWLLGADLSLGYRRDACARAHG